MKTLKDFTPEVKSKIPEYIDQALKGVFDGQRYKNFNLEAAEKCVHFNYERAGFKKPIVLVAGNPYESQVIINHIKKNHELMVRIYLMYCLKNGIEINPDLKATQLYTQLDTQLATQKLEKWNDYLFTMNVYSSCYFSWYKFMSNELKIDSKINADLEIFSSLYEQSNIYSAVFSELVCVVSKFPKKVLRDTEFRLHNPVGPAVVWDSICEQTNFENYYIHGRNLPKWIWDKSEKGEITREMFLNETNEEIKGGIYEVMGQRKVMELLGATCVNKKQIKHANGDVEQIELYKTKDTFAEIDNQPFAWVKVCCPSTGANYLLGVEPHHKSAKKALASLSPFSESEYSYNFRA